ncbi:hypothetical protein Poli38472_001802 [Pythium oligandrum]|uniref:Chitin-binding type-4 domain-containing protein n=1 Tax=Pythium oligandrum TaxID=41045 RepID=A0A8K1FNQ6_PYTOL|nr:hypothetical protein Poli38472_001802 [Pythium oligandrum]|eukprot:TMW69646.1 hypothetical protein Poli38472_001802 [Pythium oligandrum]
MKLTTIFVTAVVAAPALYLAPSVEAHGGMIKPVSRAIRTMKLAIDSTFGHPIPMRASYTNGKGGDCIDFTPDTNLQAIPFGESKIKMRANDGANHIGMCTAYLINPKDKNSKIKVGEMKDCMRSLHPGPGNKGDQPIPAEKAINIPKDQKVCGAEHCVLQFTWDAAHLAPNIEHYNNCADVKLSGGGGNPAPAPSPTTKTPAPGTSMVPAPAPVPPPVPAPTPTTGAPSKGNGKYRYKGGPYDRASMDQWCNWNCPNFCPSDTCELVK